MKGTVYLIHFAGPFGHARHYIGWAQSLNARLKHHRDGNGSRLMAAVTAAGIDWDVVKTWENEDRNFERKLKNQKHAWKHCPICREARGSK